MEGIMEFTPMDDIYGLGVACLQFVQDWMPYDTYFEIWNELSSPYHATEKLFPLVSIVDSVFAAQLLLCLSFGGWMTTILKWFLLEERPYWWVRETSYYNHELRPKLRQTRQTCETGPGSPSGHSSTMAMIVMLLIMSAAHVASDRHWRIPRAVQEAAHAATGVAIGSVMLARMYVSAHFPHQVVLGAVLGLFLGPFLCIYVCDPYVWCGARGARCPRQTTAQLWHVASAACAAAMAVLTYWGLTACHQDPMRTVKLAFRWCEYPEHLHVTSTPVFSLVQCSAYLLGWALSVTPAVTNYRHNTKNRSLIISSFATALTIYGFQLAKNQICESNTQQYYVVRYILYALKPLFYLRIIPALSMWPYSVEIKDKLD